MKMIPPRVSEHVESDAERLAFGMLSDVDLAEPARCFHSVNLPEHQYKLTAEIDFLVVTRNAVIALEVKGGSVHQHDGMWEYTDRHGTAHRSTEGPFRQGQTAMYALRNRLQAEFGPAVRSGFAFGYAVLCPDCLLDVRSVEWPVEVFADRGGISGPTGMQNYLKRVLRYWTQKEKPDLAVGETLFDQVVAYIRPDFDRVPALARRAQIIANAMYRLTGEQYERLDAVEESPRIIVSGGAGTGKTLVALEVARRHAARGERVLLTCAGPALAHHLEAQPDSSAITIAPISAIRKWEVPELFDVLVMDEGQDLINYEDIELLDGLLEGGFDRGTWRVFCDPNQQSGLLGSFDQEAFAYLSSHSHVPARLRQNCRNTEEIVTQTQLLTGADLGVAKAGKGPPVKLVSVRGAEDEGKALGEYLTYLAGEGVELGSITILRQSEDEGLVSALDHLPARWARKTLAIDESNPRSSRTMITVARVGVYKGMENDFVCLVDMRHEGEPDLNSLYVGMSRARVGLWVAIPETQKDSLEVHVRRHMDKVKSERPRKATPYP